jgi:hypothetical protein
MSASSAQILSNEKSRRLEKGEDLEIKSCCENLPLLFLLFRSRPILQLWFQSESGVVSCVLSVVSEDPAQFVNACEKDEKKPRLIFHQVCCFR